MPFIKRKRLWRKGKEAGYLVSPNVNTPSAGDSSERRPSHDTDASLSAASSLASLDITDDSKKHRFRQSSLGDGFSSVGSLDDIEVWDSISMDEKAVRLLSSHKRHSVAPEQIQVEINEEKAAEKPKKHLDSDDYHVDPIDEETAAHVQNVVSSIMKKYKKYESSDSESSTAENSEIDLEVSSDEESDDEKGEIFDFHAHIKNICKREDGSDSESDGNESVTSENAVKTAVRKAMRKIKRERSDELAESDKESEKGSEKEEKSPKSDDDSSSEKDGDESESSEDEKGSFEMARDVDPEIQELMEGGLVIDPKKGQSDAEDSRTVYRYYMNNQGKVDSVPETIDNLSDEGEDPPTANKQEDNLASTLEHSKAEDLRWPFSNFYVKEIDQEALSPENCDALPSYRSTQATASHPGRKRNVMLGRVWWVEWWAREDTKMKSNGDSPPSL